MNIEDKHLPLGTVAEMIGMSRSRLYAVKELDARFPRSDNGKYSLFAVSALVCIREYESMTPAEYQASRKADQARLPTETDKQTQALIKKCYTEINAGNAAAALSQTIGDYIQMLSRYA